LIFIVFSDASEVTTQGMRERSCATYEKKKNADQNDGGPRRIVARFALAHVPEPHPKSNDSNPADER